MSPEAEGKDLMRQADALIAEGKYGPAIDLAREALLRAPQLADHAWLSIAVAEESAGRLTAAVSAFRKAVGFCQRPPAAVVHALGLMLYETGKYGGAAVCFEIACKDEPKPYHLVMLARSLYRVGLREEGIHAAEKAIECDPTYEEAYQILGYYLLDTNPERASVYLLKAIRINPEYARAHGTLSELAWRKGDCQKAVQHARRGVESDPGNIVCWVRMGRGLEGLGDIREAEVAFRKSLGCCDDDNESWARREFAGFLQRQGRYDDARMELEYVLRAWPDEEDSYECYAAFLAEALGQNDGAAKVRESLEEVRRLLRGEAEQE